MKIATRLSRRKEIEREQTIEKEKMELYRAEALKLQTLLREWSQHPEYELEATFGAGGAVDSTTFLNVAQRLRAKGYRALPQEDRLSVITPEQIRFTLSGMGIVQSYCRDDQMAGKPYTAMIKDRAGVAEGLDIDDYDTRMKIRRELPMAANDPALKQLFGAWDTHRKAFRLIRRWSFEGEGIRFDLSIVRSTKKDAAGQYRWQRRFRDQAIADQPPTFEIEAELLRMEDDTEEAALKRFVKGVGEILRGIQKSTILIRKSGRKQVLSNYRSLTGADTFRGPPPVTLEMKNFIAEKMEGEPNLRDGYNVTDKADGLRTLGFVDESGELFLIDMGMNVYRTGLVQPACRLSLVDGEWVSRNKFNEAIQQFMVFDIFYAPDKKSVADLPFKTDDPEACRHGQLTAWSAAWMKSGGPSMKIPGLSPKTWLQVAPKDFLFARAGDASIFQAAQRMLDKARVYHTDGLIFTPNAMPLPRPGKTFFQQFKWKPAKDNTIDFLVVFEKVAPNSKEDKITRAEKPGTRELVSYKTMRLYVGSKEDPMFKNPRDFILFERSSGEGTDQRRKFEYRPVPFTPIEYPDTMASICYIPVEEDPDTGAEYAKVSETGEPIQDKSIVEMAYDPSQPPGWRWYPLRVRMDKTERLQRGILSRTLNSDMTAEGVWNSIHEPITTSMISTGAEQPRQDEVAALQSTIQERKNIAQRYYDRQATKQDMLLVRGMIDFHNRHIKEQILLKPTLQGGKLLLDMSCGKASDLGRWARTGASMCLGVDIAGDGILNPQDGAYRRLLNWLVRLGRDRIPPTLFCIGDASKDYRSGEAGATTEEKDIMRAVFGGATTGPVPPYVDNIFKGRYAGGADVCTMMFSLHYMFRDPGLFDGFLANLNTVLRVGGYFIGCCFDGDAVFELLRGIPKGGTRVGMEGDTKLWALTKQYEDDEMPEENAAFGMAVDVDFISIGARHVEYLVPFKLLTSRLQTIGCELVDAAGLKKLGLKHSTAMFQTSHEMAEKSGRAYRMPEAAKQFSFLNRWFIFQRKSRGAVAPEAVAAAVAAATEAAPGAPVASGAPTAPIVEEAAAAAAETSGDAAAAAETLVRAATAAGEGAAAAAAPVRTIPVAPGSAAPQARYTAKDVFQFYADSSLRDILKIGDKGAARWLTPSAPFPIQDGETAYPSIEHYMAAMRYKLASNHPELAESLFSSRVGTIHQKFIRQRQLETDGGTKALSEERDFDLLKEEAAEVKAATRPAFMKKYRAVLDEVAWAAAKDKVLADAVEQRWTRDARFRKIVEAAREQGKTLLYYTPGSASNRSAVNNLGGVHRRDGQIEGENKYGKLIMAAARFPGF